MKKILIFFVFITALSTSCRKNSKDMVDNTTPSSSFFISDTTTIFYSGLKASTADELRSVPIFAATDTSHVPVFERSQKIEDYEIKNFPAVGDQDPNNSCIGWALGYGLMGYEYRVLDKNSHLDLSPSFIWNQINNGLNQGDASFVRALNLVKEKGTCLLSLMSDKVAITVKPDPDQLDNALDYTISDYERLPEPNISLMKALLRRNLPILFAFTGDRGFTRISKADWERLPADQTVGQPYKFVWKQNENSSKFLHALVLTGYDDAIQAFKFQNSWGTEKWVPGGIAWITYDLFKEVVLKNDAGPEIFLAIRRIATTGDATPGQATATANGEIYNTGFFLPKSRGFCCSENKRPTISDNRIEEAASAGKFSLQLKGLKANTKYYVRAFSSDGVKTLYGNQISFTTLGSSIPTLSTTIPSSITRTSAISGGIITNDGGTDILAKGIIYSKDGNFANSTNKDGGNGSNTFLITITGLSANTIYYAKAYATNSVGTAYGNEVSVTTLASTSYNLAGSGTRNEDITCGDKDPSSAECALGSFPFNAKLKVNDDDVTGLTDFGYGYFWVTTGTITSSALELHCDFTSSAPTGATATDIVDVVGTSSGNNIYEGTYKRMVTYSSGEKGFINEGHFHIQLSK